MNVDFSQGSRGGAKRMLFWEAGNLSPRDLEFSPGLRAILDKFRESWKHPLRPLQTKPAPDRGYNLLPRAWLLSQLDGWWRPNPLPRSKLK